MLVSNIHCIFLNPSPDLMSLTHSSWNLSFSGFKPAKHMVFSGLYPANGSDFDALNHAIERLTCNDSSVSVAKESSTALGMGFR